MLSEILLVTLHKGNTAEGKTLAYFNITSDLDPGRCSFKLKFFSYSIEGLVWTALLGKAGNFIFLYIYV